MNTLTIEAKRSAVRAAHAVPYAITNTGMAYYFSRLTPEQKALSVVCPVDHCKAAVGSDCVPPDGQSVVAEFVRYTPHTERIRRVLEMEAGEKTSIQRIATKTPDELAAALNEIFKDVQQLIHDQWDWMNASFYTECLRSMANDAALPTPHPGSSLEELLVPSSGLLKWMFDGTEYSFFSRHGMDYEINRRLRAADANGYERRKREEGE